MKLKRHKKQTRTAYPVTLESVDELLTHYETFMLNHSFVRSSTGESVLEVALDDLSNVERHTNSLSGTSTEPLAHLSPELFFNMTSELTTDEQVAAMPKDVHQAWQYVLDEDVCSEIPAYRQYGQLSVHETLENFNAKHQYITAKLYGTIGRERVVISCRDVEWPLNHRNRIDCSLEDTIVDAAFIRFKPTTRVTNLIKYRDTLFSAVDKIRLVNQTIENSKHPIKGLLYDQSVDIEGNGERYISKKETLIIKSWQSLTRLRQYIKVSNERPDKEVERQLIITELLDLSDVLKKKGFIIHITKG